MGELMVCEQAGPVPASCLVCRGVVRVVPGLGEIAGRGPLLLEPGGMPRGDGPGPWLLHGCRHGGWDGSGPGTS